MSNAAGKGQLRASLKMVKYEKLYFDNYADAQIWLENATVSTDGEIRPENGRFFIFVRQS